MDVALITLLHILVFVYWLGGDLGVFYSSTILTDTKTSAQGRIVAAKVLAQVDMAPRTAMILTLPTGLTLGASLGVLDVSAAAKAAAWAFAAIWLWLAWSIHLKHLPPSSLMRRVDLAIRWVVIGGLLAWAAFGALPLFIKLKLSILATTIMLGLLIRRALGPFAGAFGAMVATGPTPETDAAISRCLDQSRPWVLCIWALLMTAALLGLAKPY
jgi:hypothetical protein